jgi:hypothetical protein
VAGTSLGVVGGTLGSGQGLDIMGGALTRYCRILSVVLNFQEPRCCMPSSNSRLVIVRLRVNGTRTGITAVAGEEKRRPHLS